MFTKILLESKLENPILTVTLWMMNLEAGVKKGSCLESSGRKQGKQLCMGGIALQKEHSAYIL